ncbi:MULTISPECIES: hypothetical protein [unclassified Lactobacillus]|uniref:hypothetical protein n=1 Tax=unclassified Lactobacillus TaxID=2620435 RepID=UPI00226A9BB1|nr:MULTISPECIES: hypothetical protein [unclassified Lactobacillus]MCX8720382.1 hypothetical protein [Lactobacillus sp. B4010]MCX8732799.1 hypothetical protein [Lactobacillus sp. B4015]MCX8735148.1 hypothetical protein [Lactobacillus sp. B4012]
MGLQLKAKVYTAIYWLNNNVIIPGVLLVILFTYLYFSSYWWLKQILLWIILLNLTVTVITIIGVLISLMLISTKNLLLWQSLKQTWNLRNFMHPLDYDDVLDSKNVEINYAISMSFVEIKTNKIVVWLYKPLNYSPRVRLQAIWSTARVEVAEWNDNNYIFSNVENSTNRHYYKIEGTKVE